MSTEPGENKMSITELLQKAKFVVDPKGRKKAVVLDFAVWEELLTILEDLEDAEEIRQLCTAKEETIPWEQAKADLQAAGIDV